MVGYTLPGGLLGHLSRNWWLVVLRGVAAVLFGLLALLWPGLTLVALAVVFGVYALVDAAAVGYAAYHAESGTRAPLVVQAVLTLIMGLIALLWPLVAVVALVFVVGAWAIITGVGEIVTAVRLRAQISSEWLLVFVGALSVIFGLLLWFWPLAGAQAIVFVIGIYAIVFGVVLTVAGFRLRNVDGLLDEPVGYTGPDEQADSAAEDEGAAEGETGRAPGDEWAESTDEPPERHGPLYGGDLLGRVDPETGPTETFDPGERFEHPRRPGTESPESSGVAHSYFERTPEEPEGSGLAEDEEPGEGRRGGRHRAPRRED